MISTSKPIHAMNHNAKSGGALSVLIPALLLAIALVFAILATKLRPESPKESPEKVYPIVEYVLAEKQSVSLEIESQGTVQARTEATLTAEVSGRIESISSELFAGGFFRKGDELLRIDPSDYEANRVLAISRLAEAKLAYEQEVAQANQAREDWKAMDKGSPSPLVLREPQLERANASLAAAQSAVAIAERDLDRTVVRAPFDGRVREKSVAIGQIANARATTLARIYSVDIAEIRLPLSLNDTQFIDVPEIYRDDTGERKRPKVIIESAFGDNVYTWNGVIDRAEGAIDPRTRLATLVAQVDNPYAKTDRQNQPPLKVGLFVTARIQGKTIDNAFVIPRNALRPDGKVYIIDDENRIRFMDVEVLKRDTLIAIITDGLEAGDRICMTPLEYAVDGMEIRIEGEEPIDEIDTERAQ